MVSRSRENSFVNPKTYLKVSLVAGDHEGLVCKEGLNAVEEGGLLGDGIATGTGEVQHKEDCGPQMGQSGNGEHLDSVAVLKGMIEDTRRVDDLDRSGTADVERGSFDTRTSGPETIRFTLEKHSGNGLAQLQHKILTLF